MGWMDLIWQFTNIRQFPPKYFTNMNILPDDAAEDDDKDDEDK